MKNHISNLEVEKLVYSVYNGIERDGGVEKMGKDYKYKAY